MLGVRHFAQKSILILGLCAAIVGCPSSNNQVAILVSPEVLDFGLTQNTATFTVRKVAASPPLPGFNATVSHDWITVNPTFGTSTGPSDRFTFTVTIIRQNLAAGDNVGTVTVGSEGIVPRTVTIKARARVAAGFTVEPTEPFVTDTVTFTDTSTVAPGEPPITQWQWDFGDGTGSTAQNPTHQYLATGNYTVRLTVWSGANQDVEEKVGVVRVQAPVLPQANFTISDDTPIVGQQVTFTDTSTSGTGPITNWQWLFGDGFTSNDQSPVHTYAEGGNFVVTLVVSTQYGTSTIEKPISVSTVPPVAAFTFPGGNLYNGDPVQFTDTSVPGTAPITTFAWNFGDGNSSNLQNPVHTFANAGTFNVTLTVTTAHGTDSQTTPVTILQRQAPTANFTASTTNPSYKEVVQFTDTSLPGSAPITSWLWNFGDGGTSTQQNPTHAYQNKGSFTVSLTVTSNHGTNTKTVVNFITVPPAAPIADFTVSDQNPFEDESITFTDISQPGTSPITQWAWTFGDGNTSTQQNPSHVYQNPGTYQVSLTVRSVDGQDTEVKPAFVVVRPTVAPTADFTASTTTPLSGSPVNFTDTSQPGTSAITSWLWDFGDGATSTEQNPTHTFTTARKHTISLTVTSAHGSDTETKVDYIDVKPHVDFVANPTTAIVGKGVKFTDLTDAGSIAVVGWLWKFGDGLSSNQQNPIHIYGVEGTFDIELTVTLENGTTATLTKPAYVTTSIAGPTANFTASNYNPAPYERVTFTDTSDPGSAAITSWSWNLGNATSSARNAFTTYTEFGNVEVSLTVTTAFGSSSKSKTISVGGPVPVAQFKQDKSVVYRGLTVPRFNSLSYIEGNGIITGQTWYVWQDGGVGEPGMNYGRGNGTTYFPNIFNYYYYGSPFDEPGLYNVTLSISAATMIDPGDPENPANLTTHIGAGITKNNAVEVLEPSALDAYVRLPDPDPTYQYSIVNKAKANGVTTYTLNMVSQSWDVYAPSAPSPKVWQHEMIVIQPDTLANNTALLYLDAEDDANGGKSAETLMTDFAKTTGSVVAILRDVPNQPITYPHLGESVEEDRLIAASLDAFLQTGDPNTIVLYPMVKSGVRAMDTVQKLMADPAATGNYPPVIVEGFVVAGGSPQGWALGWTTWLMGSADPRVKGIIPIGFNALNLPEQFELQLARLGHYPEALDDYLAPSPQGFELANELFPRTNTGNSMYWPLQIKEDWRRLERIQRLILEDIRENGFFPTGDQGNDLSHLPDLRDLLDKDEGDPATTPETSFYEVLDHLEALGGFPGAPAARAATEALIAKIDALIETPPDTPAGITAAAIEIAGGLFPMYGGDAGALGDLLKTLEQNLKESNSRIGAWLQYLIDPIIYNDPYTQILQFSSEYGDRLRMPKYIINATGDTFTSPDSTDPYFGYLTTEKLLRLVPGKDRALDGYAQAVHDAMPWYQLVVAGDPLPKFKWTFIGDEQIMVEVPNAPAGTQVILWTAVDPDGTDFRIDPVHNPDSPEWFSQNLSLNANNVAFMQIFPSLTGYTAAMIEVRFPSNDPNVPLVVTSSVHIVPPYQSPFKKAPVAEVAPE